MKKFLMVVIMCLFAGVCFAASQPVAITYGTVDFNSTEAFVMTFNSATTNIQLTNHSVSEDCYIDFICRDQNDKTGFATRGTVLLMKLGHSGPASNTDNTINIDFGVTNIGFISDTGSGTITYVITGDSKLRNYPDYEMNP